MSGREQRGSPISPSNLTVQTTSRPQRRRGEPKARPSVAWRVQVEQHLPETDGFQRLQVSDQELSVL